MGTDFGGKHQFMSESFKMDAQNLKDKDYLKFYCFVCQVKESIKYRH